MRLREQLERAEYQLGELRVKYNQLVERRRADNLIARERVGELEGQVAKLEMRAELAERRAENAEVRADAAVMLAKELSKNITRAPEVISESILTGLATILQGYQQTAADTPPADDLSMGALGLDNMGGVMPGHFFPDIEFDGAPEQWPTPGMMSSPLPTSPDHTPVHSVGGNGQVNRVDGLPMFKAGESGPPPVGGLE